MSDINNCYNYHNKKSQCESSEYCNYDESSKVCLKNCNKLHGKIKITSKDLEDNELTPSMLRLIQNVNDYSECLKDMNFLKYFKESLLSKTEDETIDSGFSLNKDEINPTLNKMKIPENPIPLEASSFLEIGKISPGDIFDGTKNTNILEGDIHLYKSKTMSEIYTLCINDDNLKDKKCCELLRPQNYEPPSTGGTGDPSTDDVSEGMISFTLNDGTQQLDDNEFLKIDESGLNEIINCHIDNITEVQRYKYFRGWIFYFFISVGIIILLRALIWFINLLYLGGKYFLNTESKSMGIGIYV
tara:strand:+ start:936 stop:1838 length:903 start_codon:yes stop_codon:yes gene_type:complete